MDGPTNRPAITRKLHSFFNNLSYRQRQFFGWTPGSYSEPPEPKAGLFDGYPPESRAELETYRAGLELKYDLKELAEQATRLRYRETLTYLAYLEQFLAHAPLPQIRPLRWLDVGARNWSYVEAMYRLLEANCAQDFELLGIEVDPNRRFIDFQTRASYARRFIRSLLNARYQATDLLALDGSFEVISVFLPFVFEEPCLAWGLPLSCFQPEQHLKHMIHLLSDEGLLLIQNQGADEAEAQERLFETVAREIPIQWIPVGLMPSPFVAFKEPRYGWICRKMISPS